MSTGPNGEADDVSRSASLVGGHCVSHERRTTGSTVEKVNVPAAVPPRFIHTKMVDVAVVGA
jgi:hypothetical protein